MKSLCFTLCGCALLLGLGQAAEKKDDKAIDTTKLLGTWEVLKSDDYPVLFDGRIQEETAVSHLLPERCDNPDGV